MGLLQAEGQQGGGEAGQGEELPPGAVPVGPPVGQAQKAAIPQIKQTGANSWLVHLSPAPGLGLPNILLEKMRVQHLKVHGRQGVHPHHLGLLGARQGGQSQDGQAEPKTLLPHEPEISHSLRRLKGVCQRSVIRAGRASAGEQGRSRLGRGSRESQGLPRTRPNPGPKGVSLPGRFYIHHLGYVPTFRTLKCCPKFEPPQERGQGV